MGILKKKVSLNDAYNGGNTINIAGATDITISGSGSATRLRCLDTSGRHIFSARSSGFVTICDRNPNWSVADTHLKIGKDGLNTYGTGIGVSTDGISWTNNAQYAYEVGGVTKFKRARMFVLQDLSDWGLEVGDGVNAKEHAYVTTKGIGLSDGTTETFKVDNLTGNIFTVGVQGATGVYAVGGSTITVKNGLITSIV